MASADTIAPSAPSPDPPKLSLKVEFGGGLDLLFSNERKHTISIGAKFLEDGQEKEADVRHLIRWLRENKLKERPELFMEGNTMSVSDI